MNILIKVLVSLILLVNYNAQSIAEIESKVSADTEYGNTAGNIMNLSYAAGYENYAYFINYGDSSRIYKISFLTKEIEKVSDISADEIHLLNGKIYFGNVKDNSSIYTMNIDGTNIEKINDQTSGFVNVMTDKIVFGTYPDYEIQTLSLKDGLTTKLNNDESYFLQIYNNKLYFVNLSKHMSLNRYDFNKGVIDEIFPEQIGPYIIYDEYIYHVVDKKICKTDLDGGNSEILIDYDYYSFNIADNSIYYIDNGNICEYLLDNDKVNILKSNVDESFKYINIVGDLLFIKNEMNNETYIITKSGNVLLSN